MAVAWRRVKKFKDYKYFCKVLYNDGLISKHSELTSWACTGLNWRKFTGIERTAAYDRGHNSENY